MAKIKKWLGILFAWFVLASLVGLFALGLTEMQAQNERDRREVMQRYIDAGAKAESLGVSADANPMYWSRERELWLEGWMQSRERRGAHTGSW